MLSRDGRLRWLVNLMIGFGVMVAGAALFAWSTESLRAAFRWLGAPDWLTSVATYIALCFAVMATLRKRATPRWRTEPPTPDEVKIQAWWWNRPVGGTPHVLQLDIDQSSGLIHEAGSGTYPFDPDDWPGEWSPCKTPSV
jgi:hypothetical protein